MTSDGHTRLLYLLLSAVGALVILLAGFTLNHQVSQVERVLQRLDSIDQRVARLEAAGEANVEARTEAARRLGVIEDDLKAVRENIRKMY